MTFTPDQRYVSIDIPVIDNSIPEGEKYFLVELVNPTGGAKINPLADVATVTLQHSDHAFGVFMFAMGSLVVMGEEEAGFGYSEIPVKVRMFEKVYKQISFELSNLDNVCLWYQVLIFAVGRSKKWDVGIITMCSCCSESLQLIKKN